MLLQNSKGYLKILLQAVQEHGLNLFHTAVGDLNPHTMLLLAGL
jgi:hypothetical protein